MSRSSLLLIEMSPHVAGITELFFQGRGFEVHPASSGPEALAIAARTDLDTVIIHHAPGLVDGFELASRIVAMSSRNPKVIITVGSDDPGELARRMPPWVDAIVPRPYHPRALADAMRAISRRRSAEIAAAAAPEPDLSNLPVPTSAFESTLPQ